MKISPLECATGFDGSRAKPSDMPLSSGPISRRRVVVAKSRQEWANESFFPRASSKSHLESELDLIHSLTPSASMLVILEAFLSGLIRNNLRDATLTYKID